MSLETRDAALEAALFQEMGRLVDRGEIGLRPECCVIRREPGYVRPDGRAALGFALALEARPRRGATPARRILFDCVSGAGPVTPAHLQAFADKVRQVPGAHGILVSRGPLQTPPRGPAPGQQQRAPAAPAAASHTGFLRYLGHDALKWRPTPAAHGAPSLDAWQRSLDLDAAVADPGFRSRYLTMAGWIDGRLFHSPAALVQALCFAGAPGAAQEAAMRALAATAPPASGVPPLDFAALEQVARAEHRRLGYQGGSVDLEAIAAGRGADRAPIRVRVVARGSAGALATLDGPAREITLFENAAASLRCRRLALAHELAHLLLGHERWLEREYTVAEDLWDDTTPRPTADVRRMEWQANVLAGCLLMPREHTVNRVRALVAGMGRPDKGFGLLFVDDQEANRKAHYAVTTALRAEYAVAQATVDRRLAQLGLLHDARSRFRHISEQLSVVPSGADAPSHAHLT